MTAWFPALVVLVAGTGIVGAWITLAVWREARWERREAQWEERCHHVHIVRAPYDWEEHGD